MGPTWDIETLNNEIAAVRQTLEPVAGRYFAWLQIGVNLPHRGGRWYPGKTSAELCFTFNRRLGHKQMDEQTLFQMTRLGYTLTGLSDEAIFARPIREVGRAPEREGGSDDDAQAT